MMNFRKTLKETIQFMIEKPIRIDNPDYSNIKGGYGIFGCYVRTVHRISFRSAYLKNLGF